MIRTVVGHTVRLPVDTLKLRLVELWRGIVKPITSGSYDWQMTQYIELLQRSTGKRYLTVGEVAELEKWYDQLDENERQYLRSQFSIEIQYADETQYV